MLGIIILVFIVFTMFLTLWDFRDDWFILEDGDPLKPIRCERCGSSVVENQQWVRGWDTVYGGVLDDRGDRCYDCGYINWTSTKEELILHLKHHKLIPRYRVYGDNVRYKRGEVVGQPQWFVSLIEQVRNGEYPDYLSFIDDFTKNQVSEFDYCLKERKRKNISKPESSKLHKYHDMFMFYCVHSKNPRI